MILTNKRAMIACFSAIVGMAIMLFIDPIFSKYLISIGFSEDYIGFAFAVRCMAYTASAPFVGMLCKILPKIYLT